MGNAGGKAAPDGTAAEAAEKVAQQLGEVTARLPPTQAIVAAAAEMSRASHAAETSMAAAVAAATGGGEPQQFAWAPGKTSQPPPPPPLISLTQPPLPARTFASIEASAAMKQTAGSKGRPAGAQRGPLAGGWEVVSERRVSLTEGFGESPVKPSPTRQGGVG